MIYPVIIFLFSVWGFLLCKKINKKKKQRAPLTCPMGADCDTVIKSEFSQFFGINLEIFGMLYYLFIGISYLLIFSFEPLYNVNVLFILFGSSMAAFFFSLYLTFVQAFYIKSWCTWCLTSAFITTVIFGISTYGVLINHITFVPLLATIGPFIVILHLIGFALGLGGATISDILFIKFLKDFRISKEENEVLKTMSQVVWLGLLLIVISGIGIYLPNMELLNASPKFLIKMIIVLIIIINGAFLNLIISPSLTQMSFKDNGLNATKASRFRKLAFISGAISFVSWYSAFILGSLNEVPLSFSKILSVYIIFLIIGIIVATIFERIYCSSGIIQKTD